MKIYTKYILLFAALLILTLKSNAQDTALVKGTVTAKGKPVPNANLVIEGTIDGTLTDEKGNYEFTTDKRGKAVLIITATGYDEKRMDVDIRAGENFVTVEMSGALKNVVTEEVIVTASSFTSGENSKVTLTPLEIVRIPGADADLYRAITTFPGSNQVDEGSRIVVRGGDPDEVLTILDQATLYHPFIFDDNFNTSSFTTIDPWGLRGINFSSGGFSAKFGNVVSGVLDLKSYEMPRGTGLFAVLGLANADLAGVYLSENKKFGATFSAGQTFLKPFLEINGSRNEFSQEPSSTGAGGTLAYKFSETSYLKFYANYSGDKIGVRNPSPSFDGFYNSKTDNLFSNLKFSFSPSGSDMLSTGVSFGIFKRSQSYGVLDSKTDDIYGKIRTDYSRQLSGSVDLNTGAEYEYTRYKLNGIFPQYSSIINTTAPSFSLNSDLNTGRLGAYIETQARFGKRFFAVTGLRTDYHTYSKKAAVDPRISVGYKLSEENILRAAFGVYHQYQNLDLYMRTGTGLEPKNALHYILGYEFNKEDRYIFRTELYYKDYKNLSAYDERDFTYKSTGEGFARGVDVFFKFKPVVDFTGWISYSYTDSKRKGIDSDNLTSANYDITHTVSLVTTYNFTDQFTAGATYKISTGRPYTPVIGAYYGPIADTYIPLYDEFNSDRLPTYQRVDLNAQYLFPLFGKFAGAFFVLNNLLNNDNLYGYTYSKDYSEKIPILSSQKRMVYFGMFMQF